MRAEAYRWFVRGGALALGAALGIAIVYGLILGTRVVVLVFIALLLASGLEPLIDRVRARTSLGRGATLLSVYVTFFVSVALIVLLVVPGAINQFNDLGPKLTPLLESAREWARTLQPHPKFCPR
jgi:predicted PurR-regulated permease PerM